MNVMLLGFWLFESQLIHVVAITFTALILTELLTISSGSQIGGKGSTGRRMMQMWNLFSGITSSSSESH